MFKMLLFKGGVLIYAEHCIWSLVFFFFFTVHTHDFAHIYTFMLTYMQITKHKTSGQLSVYKLLPDNSKTPVTNDD